MDKLILLVKSVKFQHVCKSIVLTPLEFDFNSNSLENFWINNETTVVLI